MARPAAGAAGPDLGELSRLAEAAAHEAGELLLRGLAGGPLAISTKSSARDLVTDLDRASEALIVRRLLAARPDDGVLAEETGERPGPSGLRWIVDPLDGTGNYLRGTPTYAVSVAAEWWGEPVLGVVYDPSRRETFTAVRGSGAYLNGSPLSVSRRTALGEALLGTGFSRDPRIRTEQATTLGRLVNLVQDIRHSGSAALDLCWVAAGRLDVYYEADLRHWDRAAGELIAAEAGARVCGPHGGPATDDLVLAGPPALVEDLRAVLAPDETRPQS
ncbi:inositol monophosphatase family protein [Micromonospora chersina]|uniref:inositol monophosphatase family protein n=1 Tax=Micromonospora chersina TaxID=47854 RepID=UPI0037B47FF0